MRRFLVILPLLTMGCYNDREHQGITDPVASGVISASVSAASIPADGASTATVTVQIDPRTATGSRSVTFKTSAGTFVGAAAATPQQLVVTADARGVATALLRSSVLVETAMITVTVGSFVAAANVAFTPPVAGDVISLKPGLSQAPGDGATIVPIAVQIAPQLVQRAVTLTASDGKFVPEGLGTIVRTPDASNRVTADLRAPLAVTNVRITGTVSGVTTETTISFVAAPPDGITVSPAAFDVPTNQSVSITSLLRRAVGSVTPGQSLTYTATDANGAAVGFFTNATTSEADQKATVLYVPNGAPVGTIVTITARVNNSNVSGQATVRIKAAV